MSSFRAETDASAAASSSAGAYDLFGLTYVVAGGIPGLAPNRADAPQDAIRIEFGKVPVAIDNPQYEDAQVQANEHACLFEYLDKLRIIIEADRRILVEAAPECDPVLLWTIILGFGSSIIGFRRGRPPLHASSILAGGRCIAFAGQTGAGKSTMAAMLMQAGYELFADDLCLVQLAPGGGAQVSAGVPELRLWDDAVDALDWRGETPFAIQENVAKSVFRRPLPPARVAPLRRIYVLGFAADGEEPGFRRLAGVAAFQALVDCLRMRPGLLRTGAVRRSFESLAALAEQVEMYRFVRPRDHAALPFWRDRLIAHFEQ